jgi:ABC-type branched-subunit amino acid transport system substrate-binding protein
MRLRLVAVVALAALAASACSVSTPRHESAALRAAGNVNAEDDDVATAVDAVTDGADPSARISTSQERKDPRRTVQGGAAASSGGAVAAAKTLASAPGVTKDSITMSIIAGFSGTLSPIVNKAYEALLTWQEDVNAGGGIYGRKIVLKKVDHKETPDGGVAACKEAQSNGSFIAAVPEGTDANVTAVDCLDAAGIPTVYFAAAADPKWKLAFSDNLTSAQGGSILASYVKNGLHAGAKKVGAIYVNQSAYKLAADSFVSDGRKAGLVIDKADVVAVEPNQASFTPQLLNMKNDGVEFLMISATAETVGILRDAKSIDFTPAFTGWGFLFDFLTEAGRNVFQGVTGLRTYATVDSAAYQTYRQHMNARGRNRDDRTTDLEGFPTYGRALLYGELLKLAGPNPTRASFVAGAETLRGFDNKIQPPISYGPGALAHVGIDAGFVAVCCNSDYTWKGTGPARSAF